MPFELIAAFALVAANGFFVATEFSIARLRPTQVAEFERERRPGAKSVRHAIEHIDAYLAACQLGITVSSLGLGVLGEPAFEELLEPVLGDAASIGGFALAAAGAFAIITLLHLVLGELAPKSLAIARTSRTVLWVAPPMRVFYLVTKPLVDFFNGLGNLVLKPFGIPPAREAGHTPHSEDELRSLLRQSQEEGLIDLDERRFTENVFSFGERRAREIMMPRPQVVFLTTDTGLQEAARTTLETGYTRLPLCEPEGGLDAPVGLIHVKDLLSPALGGSTEFDLREVARPLAVVSESTLIDALLRDLRRDRQHIALVVDEHGTAVGLVTLEDVLEEIVGEIEDEFDPDTGDLIKQEAGGLVVDGSASLREVSETLGVYLDEPHHEATIGGHVVEQLGRVPEAGEAVAVDGLRIEIQEVDGARVKSLRFPLEDGQAAKVSSENGPG